LADRASALLMMLMTLMTLMLVAVADQLLPFPSVAEVMTPTTTYVHLRRTLSSTTGGVVLGYPCERKSEPTWAIESVDGANPSRD
jgi:hypothetical protein